MDLRPSQEIARRFLQNDHRGSGLFLDMGFGKTATVLRALEDRHLPAVVVAPKRVAELVWPEEAALWRPDLDVAFAVGEPKKRQAALDLRAPLTVISRDNMAQLEDRKFPTWIIDESSGFKDQSTARFKLARRMSKDAQHVWEMTGTPSPNGYLDLWAQLFLMDRGERLDTSFTRFKSRYFFPGRSLPNGVVVDWIPRDEAFDRINEKIEDICLSMEIDDDHVPLYNTVEVELPPAVMTHYREFKKELVLDLEMLGLDIYSAANAAVLTNKLSQITAGFLYGDEGSGKVTPLHSVKVEALREIYEGTGSPVLVFYWYKPEYAAIRKTFPFAKSIDDPGAYQDWNAGKVQMLLCHPASAGHGLNLQKGPGHTIVWTTPTWNLELWQQANKRLARPGQQHRVTVHTLAARRTIDLYQLKRLGEKTDVQEALREYLESPI